MVDYKSAVRLDHLRKFKERFAAWSSPEFFEWVKTHDSQKWASIRSNLTALKNEHLADEEFELALKVFEILWIKAIYDYKCFLYQKEK